MEKINQLDTIIESITKKEEQRNKINKELENQYSLVKDIIEDFYFSHTACNDKQLMFLFGTLYKSDRSNLLSTISLSSVFTINTSSKTVSQDFRVSVSNVEIDKVIQLFKDKPNDNFKSLKTNISNIETETIDQFVSKCSMELAQNLEEIINKSKSTLKKYIKNEKIFNNLKSSIIDTSKDFAEICSVKNEEEIKKVFATWGTRPEEPLLVLKNKQINSERFLLNRELKENNNLNSNKNRKIKV